MDVEHVLIVGGGIGGLTLAAALNQRGVAVEVVERADHWVALGAGLSVQPNGMRILRHLRLDTAVIDHGSVVRHWIFADHEGGILCDIDLDRVWCGIGPFVGIARAGLQNVLVGGVSGVPCRLGTTITSIADDGQRVRVEFTDGSAGTYDLVVGADGIRSVVRDLAFGNVVPTFAGQIAWRSISPITLPGPSSVQFWLGEGCFFGLCSIADGHTYGFGYVAQARRRDPVAGRLGRLREHFAHFGTTVRDYLGHLDSDEQIHCSTIEWVAQERWHTGRVVLLGDAAHASSPMMGQGGNLAMEDAWVLAEVLHTNSSLDGALASYIDRRGPRVKWVQQQSQAVADSFGLPADIRNGVLRERGDEMFSNRYAPLVQNP